MYKRNSSLVWFEQRSCEGPHWNYKLYKYLCKFDEQITLPSDHPRASSRGTGSTRSLAFCSLSGVLLLLWFLPSVEILSHTYTCSYTCSHTYSHSHLLIHTCNALTHARKHAPAGSPASQATESSSAGRSKFSGRSMATPTKSSPLQYRTRSCGG